MRESERDQRKARFGRRAGRVKGRSASTWTSCCRWTRRWSEGFAAACTPRLGALAFVLARSLALCICTCCMFRKRLCTRATAQWTNGRQSGNLASQGEGRFSCGVAGLFALALLLEPLLLLDELVKDGDGRGLFELDRVVLRSCLRVSRHGFRSRQGKGWSFKQGGSARGCASSDRHCHSGRTMVDWSNGTAAASLDVRVTLDGIGTPFSAAKKWVAYIFSRALRGTNPREKPRERERDRESNRESNRENEGRKGRAEVVGQCQSLCAEYSLRPLQRTLQTRPG